MGDNSDSNLSEPFSVSVGRASGDDVFFRSLSLFARVMANGIATYM